MGNKVIKEILAWGKEIVIAVLVVVVLNFFFATTTVYNVSMFPTLQDGDMLLLIKFGGINRGDIVSFRSQLKLTERDVAALNFLQKFFHKVGDRKLLIKRVIGIPGDVVMIREGLIYINGERIEEPYLNVEDEFGRQTADIDEFMLGSESYFVLGDNRSHSMDSRDFGVVHTSDIIGKTLIRFWPLTRFGRPNGL